MTKYVTEQLLNSVKAKGYYPQEIQRSKTVWIRFDPIGLSVIRRYPRKVLVKRVNGWKTMRAEEINRMLDAAVFLEKKVM